ncbi:MAG TPA: PIF1 family DEAD/DEAH box helicase [Patescibacteria group bacterium]|nr:PIF1 family DEAD/DEAH box helicase [Patescibacteria group bacterium]
MTQQQALDILKLGYNVYLTGPAGSGKTYLLNKYIEYLKEHKIPVGITASTGIAATHMSGTTIHSWVGMGIKDSMNAAEIADLFKRQYLRKRFLHTKVLIIDEISMLHGFRLDLVHQICSTFHRNDLPFGGMQVIMCGDFFQLPPVTKFEKKENSVIPSSSVIPEKNETRHAEFISASSCHSHENGNLYEKIPDQVRNDKNCPEFVTDSEIWKKMRLKICYLDEQHRQDDRAFLRVLNDIRNSEVNEMTVEYLSERLDKKIEGYSKPTKLFTHNTDVDAINTKHLNELTGEAHEYFMSSRGSVGLTQILRKSCLAPEKLVLKMGAQVMFVKNNYEVGYVNGTLGEVIGFDKEDHPIVRTFDGKEIVVMQAAWEVKEEEIEKAAISQLPLRLAWAITVHKSQGMSLDAAEIDLSRSFIPGMGYVALSRIRSLSGLKLMGMNQMALLVNPDIAKLDREFILASHEAASELHSLGEEKKMQMQKEYLEYLLGLDARQ